MEYSPITILDDIVARQIAAGEVIDRPAAVLRELIDNSIDADATQISVYLKESGLSLIQVSDNGIGIQKQDLPLACRPHATSKITTSNDLQHIRSMGFRGEALASIAAASKVILISKHRNASDAWKIEANALSISHPEKVARNTGTTVHAEQLFQDIPARKKFLSTPHAELTHLKTMFIRKLAAFPHISASLQHNTQNILSFPAESSLVRSMRLFSNQYHTQDFIEVPHTTSDTDPELSIHATLGLPSIAQRTRRNIYIYINNRQVKEFSLVQAIEHAYASTIHGGAHPQAVIFLSIPPQQLDVNIHPAKSEVKIKGIEPIRHLVINTITQHLTHFSTAVPQVPQSSLFVSPSDLPRDNKSSAKSSTSTHSRYTSPPAPPHSHISSSQERKIFSHAKPLSDITRPYIASHNNHVSVSNPTDTAIRHAWRYVDTLFNTYLLFESKEQDKEMLLMLDFHATHEKNLFDTLSNSKETFALLAPITLNLDIDTHSIPFLIEQYRNLGIIITQDTHTPPHYMLQEIPENSPINADSIAKLIETLPVEDIEAKLFSTRACRLAAKAGDHVDSSGAYMLLSYALSLDTPRCPHGRPLWVEITKYQLDSLIGRV